MFANLADLRDERKRVGITPTIALRWTSTRRDVAPCALSALRATSAAERLNAVALANISP